MNFLIEDKCSKQDTIQWKDFPILSLPDCALEHILSFLSYDQAAQMRRVSKRFDVICKRYLNSGFRAAERFHAKCLKEVKSKLPRRESVRRNHPFSRHSDILSAIDTRMSLLSMTFMKYVEMNLCCFIPGKVIDEIFHVLRVIKHDKYPPRAYEILQELRDISSMAMEHFDEKIVPTFKLNTSSQVSPSKLLASPGYISTSFSTLLDTPSTSTMAASTLATIIQETVAVQQKRSLAVIKKQIRSDQKVVSTLKSTQNDQGAKLSTLKKCLSTQENVIKCQAEKIKEMEVVIAAQSEKIKDSDAKFSALLETLEDFRRRLTEVNPGPSEADGKKPNFKRASSSSDDAVEKKRRKFP